MDLTHTDEFTADPYAVYGALTDQTVREAACEAGRPLSSTVTITPVDGNLMSGATVRIVRTMRTDKVPGFARKLVGESITVDQTEVWSAAGPDGARTAAVTGTMDGIPVSIKGSARLASNGSGCERSVQLQFSVNIPFVGKQAEPFVGEAITTSIGLEADAVRAQTG